LFPQDFYVILLLLLSLLDTPEGGIMFPTQVLFLPQQFLKLFNFGFLLLQQFALLEAEFKVFRVFAKLGF
jgi:hypothetical protein